MASPFDRPAHYNIEAEEAVLGSLLIHPEALPRVRPLLGADDFYREKHRWLYEVLLSLADRPEPVPADPVTVMDELERAGRLGDMGGPAIISELMLRVPTAIHVVHYAQTVARAAFLRRTVAAAERIAKIAYEETALEPAQVLAQAQALLDALLPRGGVGELRRVSGPMRDAYDLAERIYMGEAAVGLPSGWDDLDRLLGGFQRGDLVILAARPAAGKSALALNCAEAVAIKQQARVAYFSLEMGVDQLAQRLISSQTGINAQRLRQGPIYTEDLERIGGAVDVLDKAMLFVDDTPALSVPALRDKLRRMDSEYGVDLVVVDYLQLMSSGAGNRGGAENRTQEVSLISRSLKELARELRVPILALSQLSRGVESRQDKRPMLSDLRESGAIEQDADVVMFLYRDEMYDKNTDRPNVAEVIVAKHRNGPTGTVDLRFTRENAKFSSLETFDPESFEMEEAERRARAEQRGAPLDDIVF